MGDVTPACFPAPEATNKLASLKLKAQKAKVAYPFPFVDLAEFLPTWSGDTAPTEEGDGAAKKNRCASSPRVHSCILCGLCLCRLDMVRWVAAFQCYALAAEATEARPCVRNTLL